MSYKLPILVGDYVAECGDPLHRYGEVIGVNGQYLRVNVFGQRKVVERRRDTLVTVWRGNPVQRQLGASSGH